MGVFLAGLLEHTLGAVAPPLGAAVPDDDAEGPLAALRLRLQAPRHLDGLLDGRPAQPGRRRRRRQATGDGGGGAMPPTGGPMAGDVYTGGPGVENMEDEPPWGHEGAEGWDPRWPGRGVGGVGVAGLLRAEAGDGGGGPQLLRLRRQVPSDGPGPALPSQREIRRGWEWVFWYTLKK